MTWEEWKIKYQKELYHKYGYEERFVDLVLSKIAIIAPNDVIPQYHFIDRSGKNRYIDFVIYNKAYGFKLAIELDGYAKFLNPEYGVSNYEDAYTKFQDFLYRQNSLMVNFNKLLRYSNKYFLENSQAVIKEIEDILSKQYREFELRTKSLNKVIYVSPVSTQQVYQTQKEKQTQIPNYQDNSNQSIYPAKHSIERKNAELLFYTLIVIYIFLVFSIFILFLKGDISLKNLEVTLVEYPTQQQTSYLRDYPIAKTTTMTEDNSNDIMEVQEKARKEILDDLSLDDELDTVTIEEEKEELDSQVFVDFSKIGTSIETKENNSTDDIINTPPSTSNPTEGDAITAKLNKEAKQLAVEQAKRLGIYEEAKEQATGISQQQIDEFNRIKALEKQVCLLNAKELGLVPSVCD